jgi:hypothetical protein
MLFTVLKSVMFKRIAETCHKCPYAELDHTETEWVFLTEFAQYLRVFNRTYISIPTKFYIIASPTKK